MALSYLGTPAKPEMAASAIPAAPSLPMAPATPEKPSGFYHPYTPPIPKKNYIADYNDPYTINSLADVALNRSARNKAFDNVLDKIPLIKNINRDVMHSLGDVTSLTTLVGAGTLVKDNIIDPVMAGKPGDAAINALQNVGETLGVLGNPVKGMIMEGFKLQGHDSGNPIKGLIDGLGVGDNGRTNYDWDTGHWYTDMPLEILTDPASYMTLGVAGVAKGVAGGTLKEATAEAAEQVGQELSEQAAEQLTKEAVKKFVAGDVKSINEALAEQAKVLATNKEFLLKNAPLSEAFQKQLVDTTLDNMSIRILNTLPGIQKFNDEFFKWSWRLSFGTTGYGTAWYALSKPISAIRTYVANRTLSTYTKYFTELGIPDIFKYDEAKELADSNAIRSNKLVDAADQMPEDTHQLIMKDAVQKEYNFMKEFLDQDFAKYKDLDFQNKLTQFRNFVQEKCDPTVQAVFSKMDDETLDAFMMKAFNSEDLLATIRAQMLDDFISVNHHGPFTLEDYVNQLRVLNDDSHGAFTEELRDFEQLQKDVQVSISHAEENANKIAVKPLQEFLREGEKQSEENFNKVMTMAKQVNKGGPVNPKLVEGIINRRPNVFKFFAGDKSINELENTLRSWARRFLKDIPELNEDGFVQIVSDYLKADLPLHSIKDLPGLLANPAQADSLKTYLATYYKFKGMMQSLSYTASRLIENERYFRNMGVEHDPISNDVIKRYLALKPLIKMLRSDLKIETPAEEIQLSLNRVLYNFQLEKSYVNSQILADSKLQEIFDTLLDTNTPFGAILKNLGSLEVTSENQALVESAQQLERALKQYVNYKAFNDKILNSHMADEVKTTFLSVIQTYARYNPQLFLDKNSNYGLMKGLYEKIETQINTIKMPTPLNLQALRENAEVIRYAEEHGVDLKSLEAHGALGDVLLTKMVGHSLLQPQIDELLSDPTNVLIWLDLETTGFGGQAHSITQLGYALEGQGIKDSFVDARIRPTTPMQDRTVRAIRPVGETEDAQQKAAEFFMDANTSEWDSLVQLTSTIDSLRETGHGVHLMMHNGDKFDFNFLLDRLDFYAKNAPELMTREKYLSMRTALKIAQTHDTLRMLQREQGYFTLSHNEQNALQDLVQSLAGTQQEYDQLIQPIDQDLSELLNTVSGGLRSFAVAPESAEMANALSDYAARIYSYFQQVNEVNAKLNQEFFDKDTFFKLFEDYTNMSKLLYTDVDGIKQYGYRIAVDSNMIREWWDINARELAHDRLDQVAIIPKIPVTEAMELTRIGKILDRNYRMIKNATWLMEKQDLLRDALMQFQRMCQNDIWRVTNYVPEAFRGLRIKDPLSNFAMLRTIYTYMKQNVNYKPLDFLKGTESFEELFYILDNPEKITEKTLSDDIVNYVRDSNHMVNIERKAQGRWKYHQNWAPKEDRISQLGNQLRDKLLNTNPTLKHAMHYAEAVEETLVDFLDYTKSFKDLGLSLDKHDVATPWIQRKAAQMSSVARFLKVTQERFLKAKTPEERAAIQMENMAYRQQLADQQFAQILALDNESLLSHLAYVGHRVIAFSEQEALANELTRQAYINLQKRSAELKALDIDLVKHNDHVFLVLNKDAQLRAYNGMRYVHGRELQPVQLKALDFKAAAKVFSPEYVEQLDEILSDIREGWLIMSEKNDHMFSTGEITTPKFYEDLYDKLPLKVQELLPPKVEMLQSEYFPNINFDHSLLGSVEFKRVFTEYAPADILSTYTNTMMYISKVTETRIEYMQMYYDKSLSIDNGLLKDTSDEHILQALKQAPEYTLTALVRDSRGNVKAIEIVPHNLESIQQARRLGAVIMPYDTFSNVYKLVNQNETTSKFLQFWHKLIYTYKAGFLLSPGALYRNTIDTALKNFTISHDPIGLAANQLEALHLYRLYRETIQDMIKMSPDGVEYFGDSMEYFTQPFAKMDQKTFSFCHQFFESNSSAGRVRELEEYYTQSLTKGDMPLSEKAWNAFVGITNKGMTPNTEIEQVQRFAQYLWASKQGISTTEAMHLVAQTHFDYSLKSETAKLIELVFPFYTFTMRNLEFWARQMDDNPWIAFFLRDVMTPIWNFDGYSSDEMNRNRSLQYQILAGNLQINDAGLTLKLSPSFMDAFQLLTNPYQAVTQKLAPPLSAPIQAIQQQQMNPLLNIVPILGTEAQRIQSAQKNWGRIEDLRILDSSLWSATLRYKNRKRVYRPKTYTPQIPYPKRLKQPRYVYFKRPSGIKAAYYPTLNGNTKNFRKPTGISSPYYPVITSKQMYVDTSYRVPRTYFRANNPALTPLTGKLRLKQLMIPTPKPKKPVLQTIRDTFRYYR